MKNFYTCLLAIAIAFSGFSQITAPEIEVTAGGSAGAGEKPFWNVANQYGKYSIAPFEGIAGLKVEGVDRSGSLISF
ncbi:MAG: hypothetical protein K9G38_07050, partial [Bacteroidales bacterium]|nr:hypothetical protein [Bacteroidales bacterium]